MGICLDTDKHAKYEDDGEEIHRKQSEFKIQNLTSFNQDDLGEVVHIESDKESDMLSESMLPGLDQKKTVDLQLFDFLKVLGRGSFGKVLLVKYKETGQLFAMKILRKDIVEKRNQRIHTKNERLILERV